ncbi:M15 family metallopeptidase [Haloechinothrix sp. LS1_15]|uniref:M15 family metallopeptidase n=1 Tax=Haloechinothrix sp. LS1_15 TaxID=2652248 RepID=UPI002947D1E0|nr:M15 family metallopeptidase [Haloechinothrix sp. LS1_15]MDV6013381.1 M15 family metallopeptidase [Haloechinothrix sp. LS1_15]
MRLRFTLDVAALATAVVMLVACGLAEPADVVGQRATEAEVAAEPGGDGAPWQVAEPVAVGDELLQPDLLVLADEPIERDMHEAIGELDGIQEAASLSMSGVAVGERAVTLASGDLDALRPFTPETSATNDEVWQVVAAGDLAVDHRIGEDLQAPLGGTVALRTLGDQVKLRVGAYAETLPGVDGVVNRRRGAQLGVTGDNALLLSAGQDTPAVIEDVRDIVGQDAMVHRLSEPEPSSPAEPDDTGGQRDHLAYLTGSSVADALGSFQYRYFSDGTVEPDPQWVRQNIRTEQVPILGMVTCHKVMLPQLRAALEEIVDRGLADAIDPDDYGGCYVPRFIGHDPARGLSLHTWGIAFDINVSTNQRGTQGEIDRDVVRIFQKWGFAWGGDWEWTDPMHFELARLVR